MNDVISPQPHLPLPEDEELAERDRMMAERRNVRECLASGRAEDEAEA